MCEQTVKTVLVTGKAKSGLCPETEEVGRLALVHSCSCMSGIWKNDREGEIRICDQDWGAHPGWGAGSLWVVGAESMQLSLGRVLAGVEWADQQDKLTESGGLQSHPVWPFRTFDRSLTDLRGRVTSHGKMWVLIGGVK